MYRESRERGVNADLASRVGRLSRASQRWLKMALVAIEGVDVDGGEEDVPARDAASVQEEPPSQRPPANLEDVITGKSTLEQQLEAYPELSDEMEGLADVIDLLREAGEARRRQGDQILREEILGGSQEDGDEADAGDQET